MMEDKNRGLVLTDVKTGKKIDKSYNLKLFLEGSKIFVL